MLSFWIINERAPARRGVRATRVSGLKKYIHEKKVERIRGTPHAVYFSRSGFYHGNKNWSEVKSAPPLNNGTGGFPLEIPRSNKTSHPNARSRGIWFCSTWLARRYHDGIRTSARRSRLINLPGIRQSRVASIRLHFSLAFSLSVKQRMADLLPRDLSWLQAVLTACRFCERIQSNRA